MLLHLDRLLLTIESKDRGRPSGWVNHAHEHSDGRGLAGAVGPEVPEHLALLDLEVQVEKPAPAAVVLGQALRADRNRHCLPLPLAACAAGLFSACHRSRMPWLSRSQNSCSSRMWRTRFLPRPSASVGSSRLSRASESRTRVKVAAKTGSMSSTAS